MQSRGHMIHPINQYAPWLTYLISISCHFIIILLPMHTYPNFIKFNNYLDLMDQELSSLTKNSLSSEVVPRTKLLKIDCSSLNNSKGVPVSLQDPLSITII